MKRLCTFLLLALAFGCKKNDAPEDTVAPVVLLTSPAHNQVFNPGQSITVTGNVSDNRGLREAHLEIINTANGAFLAHDHLPATGTSYTVSKTFTVQPGATYRIRIEASDDAGNTGRGEVTVRTN